MHSKLRPSPAMVVALIALFVSLGGTAAAAVIITSNSQVASGTISGHKPPSGKHANIISGSVNATDLANQAVTAAKIKAPEAWRNVGPGSTTQDLCADPSKTAVFCNNGSVFPSTPWHNYGGGFATAGFYKDQLGIVHLKGLVAGPLTDATTPVVKPLFRLPTAYRPAHPRVFPIVGRNNDGQEVAQGRVDVRPDGLVVLEGDCAPGFVDCSASGGYVALDAISFRRDG
jgi:hypothetical protein